MQRDETPRKSKGTVTIAPGFKLWREVVCSGSDYHGMDIEVTVSWSDDLGRLVASRVDVSQRPSGDPVTSEQLRLVAVQQFVRHSIAASVRDGLTPGGAADFEPRLASGLITQAKAGECRAAGPSAETLSWVATIYKATVAVGEGPTKAVREVFGVSQSTAGAWVAAARKAGLLSASEGAGKARV